MWQGFINGSKNKLKWLRHSIKSQWDFLKSPSETAGLHAVCIQVLLGSVKGRLYLVFHVSIRRMPYQNRAASRPPLAEQKQAQKNQMVPSERRAEGQSRAQTTPTKLPQVQCKWFSWSDCKNCKTMLVKRVCTTATQRAHKQAVSVERGDSGGAI